MQMFSLGLELAVTPLKHHTWCGGTNSHSFDSSIKPGIVLQFLFPVKLK
jgi:hypothetical protein